MWSSGERVFRPIIIGTVDNHCGLPVLEACYLPRSVEGRSYGLGGTVWDRRAADISYTPAQGTGVNHTWKTLKRRLSSSQPLLRRLQMKSERNEFTTGRYLRPSTLLQGHLGLHY